MIDAFQRESSMLKDGYDFVEFANPHAWMLVASDLHCQSINLRKNSYKSYITRIKKYELKRWNSTDRAVFLLSGFALENAIKAFLVYENPEWISGGVLNKSLRTHSLLELQSKSNIIPYKKRYLWVLEKFESGIESWARYPCALKFDRSIDFPILGDDLWLGYTRIMKAYGRKMTKILSLYWEGPHGWSGHYKFTGNFFDM